MASKRIMVIGAGIAGLIAAYTLKKQGFDVTILEASTNVGGRIATSVIDGYVIDRGAQFLLSEYKMILSLIKELHLEQNLTKASSWTAIVRSGNVYRVNLNKPLSPFSSGLLTWNEWLQLVSKSIKLSRSTRNITLSDYSQWQHMDNEDAAQWCESYYGSGVKNYIFNAVFESLYLHPLDSMSKALAIATSKFFVQNLTILTLLGGMGSLPYALASRLNIVFNAKVIKLSSTSNKVIISTDEQTFEAERVILATTSSEARRLYRQADPLEHKLMETNYSSAIKISIATRRGWQQNNLKHVYGILIPPTERDIVAAVGIESNKSQDRAPEGELFNVMLSGKAAAKMIDSSNESILSRVLPELQRYFPALAESIRFVHISRWKEAEPLSPVGRSKYIFEYRNKIHSGRKIILAGDYMGMPFIEGAAETGLWAATQIGGMS